MGLFISSNPQPVRGERIHGGSSTTRHEGAMTAERAYNQQKYGTIPPHISDYPPPHPPTLKLDFVYQPLNNWKIDAEAQQTPSSKLCDFPTLVDHLTEHLKTDVQRVRAIFSWLGHQDVRNTKYPNHTDPNTPIGYLKRIQTDPFLYIQFFTLLCREADIPCVILTGKAKDFDFEVGEKDSDSSTWNAVYVEGGWRHIHCNWAYISVVGKNPGGWLKVEEDGKHIGVEIKQSEGEAMHNLTVNESYFLTPPEVFSYFCLPENNKWQLLDSPLSKKRFFSAPFITPQFADSGFTFRKGQACVLQSEKGECTIVIQANSSWTGKLKYALFYKKNITHRFPHSAGDDRYVAVLNKNAKNEIKVKLRFPIEGHYKLRIYEAKGIVSTRICDFKIICEERRAVREPFPETPSCGWGPGPGTAKAGLYNISPKEGLLELKYHHSVDISFKYKGDQKISARLTHSSLPDKSIMKFLTILIANNHVKLKVAPVEGEYALIINSWTKDNGVRNVLNYIIVSGQINKQNDSVRENPTEKVVREQLLEATKTGKKQDITTCIDKFQKLRMSDRGHLTAARRELEVAEITERLRSAIMRRREDGLEKAIMLAQTSSVKDRVKEDLDRARKVLRSLQHQRATPRYWSTTVTPQDVADLRAIRVLNAPIKEVFTAVYLLLGENRWDLQDSYNLRCLMKQSGSDGLLSRLENFNPDQVQADIVQDASRLLEKQDEEKLVRISIPVGKMYQEGMNLIQKYNRAQSLNDHNKDSSVPGRNKRMRKERSV